MSKRVWKFIHANVTYRFGTPSRETHEVNAEFNHPERLWNRTIKEQQAYWEDVVRRENEDRDQTKQ